MAYYDFIVNNDVAAPSVILTIQSVIIVNKVKSINCF